MLWILHKKNWWYKQPDLPAWKNLLHMTNTKLDKRWPGLWAHFPYCTDSFWCKNPIYVFIHSIWHSRSGLYWYKVLQAVSPGEVSHCPQGGSARLSPHKGRFSEHEWCHRCFSCNSCRIDAAPSSSLQLAVTDGAGAPQTRCPSPGRSQSVLDGLELMEAWSTMPLVVTKSSIVEWRVQID